MWNVYRMSIKIKHRNLEIRKTRNNFSVQGRNFFDIRRERGTIFLSWLFYLPPTSRATPSQGPREQAKANRLVWCPVLLIFFKFPKSSARFRCVTSFALASPHFPSRAVVTSLSDMSTLSARAWTPVLMLHLTNPCAEPKGSQPN